jgi:cyclic pyranopterin phosphate synthase
MSIENGGLAENLTHVDARGAARMVDVGGKPVSKRHATAISKIRMSLSAANAIRNNELAKGDCIQVGRIAAIQGSKWTSHLIPLCHSIAIDSVEANCEWLNETEMQWTVTVKSTGTTGVEMEALTGASVAALTIYDLCKAIDKSMIICEISLLEKSGGTKGDYVRNLTERNNES